VILSVVIPVYNEKGTLEELLRRVAAVPIPKQVVLVDDCSTDGTRERLHALAEGWKTRGPAALGLAALAAPMELTFAWHEKNAGKGAAVRTGIARTTGGIVIVQDADLEYDPADYPALVAPIEGGAADVVYGSRHLKGDLQKGYFSNYFGNRFLTFVSNRFTGLGLTDMETCYKTMRGEIARGITLRSNRFGFDPEITAKIARGKHRVVEVPVSYVGRTFEEGKKIRWQDGFTVVRAIVRYAFFD